jgi:hypothetical protein
MDFASHEFFGITSLAWIFKGLLASTLIARPFAINVKHWTAATQHAYVAFEDLTNFWRRIESKLVPCAISCEVTTWIRMCKYVSQHVNGPYSFCNTLYFCPTYVHLIVLINSCWKFGLLNFANYKTD